MSCCCICLPHKSNNEFGLLNFVLVCEIWYSSRRCIGLYTSSAFGRVLFWGFFIAWNILSTSTMTVTCLARDLLSWDVPPKDTMWRQRCPDAAGTAAISARKEVWRSTQISLNAESALSAESTTSNGRIKSTGITKKKLYLDYFISVCKLHFFRHYSIICMTAIDNIKLELGKILLSPKEFSYWHASQHEETEEFHLWTIPNNSFIYVWEPDSFLLAFQIWNMNWNVSL